MLTLYYSPRSRATRVKALLHAMGHETDVRIRRVEIRHADGTGRREPANPHPEGKVPALDTGHGLMTETSAIMLYLTDRFDSPLGRGPNDPQRGAYLMWLSYASGVQEPFYVALASGRGEDPVVQATYRGGSEIADRLDAALAKGPWLLGEDFSAALSPLGV